MANTGEDENAAGGPSPEARRICEHSTAAEVAAVRYSLKKGTVNDACRRILLSYDESGCADIDLGNGANPLHVAINLMDEQLTRSLLFEFNYKMLVNKQDKGGWSPLHYAALNESLPITQLLVETGADLWIEAGDGTLPIHCADFNEPVGLFLREQHNPGAADCPVQRSSIVSSVSRTDPPRNVRQSSIRRSTWVTTTSEPKARLAAQSPTLCSEYSPSVNSPLGSQLLSQQSSEQTEQTSSGNS
eukprot:gb/GECG01004968.1/.p1 GENE.gb/GECG01004968.1/~~gb/GECG01004968.1/.p1  ORF type:complete len:245 (+),score=24.61 gb/GECG01004968.1/:1-735(+)